MCPQTEMSRIYPSDHIPKTENRKDCATDHELKIWFSKPNSEEPLGGIENELRLIKARGQVPQHHIRLVYEPNNLTENAKEKLIAFCRRHVIELFSLDDIEVTLHQALHTGSIDTESVQVQLDLLQIAKRECHDEYGNLAAASDIVRILSPALQVDSPSTNKARYGTRIYTDFDEPLSPKIPSSFALEPDELLKTENNNNFLFAASADSLVLNIFRQRLLTNYLPQKLSNMFDNAFNQALIESMGRRPIKFLRACIDLSSSQSSENELYLLKAMEQSLMNLDVDNNGDGDYTIKDMFALRSAISKLKLSASEKKPPALHEVDFWITVYLKLVVEVSGPGVYIAPEVTSQRTYLTTLNNYSEGQSDLSWLPDSPYIEGLFKKKQSLDKNTRVIQTAYQDFKDKKRQPDGLDQLAKPSNEAISAKNKLLKQVLLNMKKPFERPNKNQEDVVHTKQMN